MAYETVMGIYCSFLKYIDCLEITDRDTSTTLGALFLIDQMHFFIRHIR